VSTPISWLAADWPAPPSVVAGTTLRSGGVSTGSCGSLNLGSHVGDDADAVAENRRRLQVALDLPADPHWLEQVHGTHVVDAGVAGSRPAADAAVARRPGVVCAVLTADCLPVLFAARDGSRVAGDLVAWLGPAISQPAFEVGPEVRARFLAVDPATARCFRPGERDRWLADLYELARMRLAARGLHSVHGGGRCTFRETNAFFSYRRDGACGRMATLIYMSDSR